MNDASRAFPIDDLYSVREVADAAGVRIEDARRRLQLGRIAGVAGHFPGREAVRLVRALASNAPLGDGDRGAISALDERARNGTAGLVASGVAHAGLVAALVLAVSLGLTDASTTESAPAPVPMRLVFLSIPGPGGGGGGGGLKQPLPPRRAQRKAVVKKTVSSPVPEVRPTPRPPAPEPQPPKPIEPAVVPPPVVEPPPPAPAPAVQAPVAPAPADPVDATGTLNGGTAASQGRGTGGGAGTGAGTGVGEGQGAGVGPGSDAGTGGGPYRAGAGIEPPQVRREVKPSYTDAARRRGVEGEVLVEIVVRRDGTVGDVRVLRRLGEGLDEKAVEAVRQWVFEPARRHGVPVDVIVEVSLQFKLR